MAIKTGIITINETALIETNSNPNLDGGLDQPVGTVAIDSETGEMYRKATASPTGWVAIGAVSENNPFSSFAYGVAKLANSDTFFVAKNAFFRVIKKEPTFKKTFTFFSFRVELGQSLKIRRNLAHEVIYDIR
jgi:hypothetical protein